MNMTTFNYFYEGQEEQYSFFRIPKKLISDPCFKNLILEGKMLYGLMLDRISLSRKNHWIDDEGRLYIIYTIEQIMGDLNCSRPSAVKALNSLDDENGIGLIKKVRRGLGRPNIIYVMDFMSAGNSGLTENQITDDVSSPNQNSLDFQKLNILTSGSKETELQEVNDFNSNNTDKSNTKEKNIVVDPPTADDHDKCDYEEIIEAWNSSEGALPIQNIAPGTQRERFLKKCISLFGKNTFLDVIRLIPKSDYLKRVKVKFDWFVRPDNFIKVKEGTYTDSYKDLTFGHTGFSNFDQRTYDYDDLERRLFSF